MRRNVLVAAAIAAAIGGTMGPGATARAGGDGPAARPAQDGGERRSIDDLIRDLASDDFDTRERATEALGKRGKEAIPALERAAKDKDPEVRWRAEKALKAARAAAGPAAPATPPDAAPPGAGERSPERPTPDPREGAGPGERRLRELEDNLRRMHPDLGEMLDGMKLREVLPKEFGKILDDMQERLRDLDRGFQDRPGGRSEFWTFRYKDGRWQIERSSDPVVEKVGIRTQPLPPVARAQLSLGDAPALVLEEVRPGSIADRAGLQRYDLVLAVDGKPVETDRDLELLARAGDHTVDYMRAGQRARARVSVAATEAPPEEEPAAPQPEPPSDERGRIRKY